LKTSPEMLELCERTNLKPSQVKAALRELQEKGFLARTTPEERDWSDRKWRDPILSEWRLTMFSCNGRPATRDYEKARSNRNGK
jgi:hypothetical protein